MQGAPLVLNGGFETGNFADWTLADGNSGFDFVDNGSFFPQIKPHSGGFQALLGQPAAPAFLSQTLATTAGTPYAISLWLNSPDGSTPNEFSVKWEGRTLFDQINLPALGWTNLQFIALATNSGSALQFGFRDDSTYLGLDDVSAQAIAAPVFQSTYSSNGVFTLVWTATAGRVYQVQFATQLLPANWTNLASEITASSNTASASDPIGSYARRFYRIVFVR